MASDPLENLSRKLASTEQARSRIEALYQSKQVTRRDTERLYEGLFIRAITTLEAFIEEQFYLTVLGRSKHARTRVVPKADFPSRTVLTDIVTRKKAYVSWLPYSETEKMARMFLRGGKPFTDITDSQRNQLSEWMTIRNAIAHSSKSARNKFHANVIGSTPLINYEKTPAGFLRSSYRPGVTPRITRFEVILQNISKLGHALNK